MVGTQPVPTETAAAEPPEPLQAIDAPAAGPAAEPMPEAPAHPAQKQA